jgi:hypothetical protein
MRHRFRLSDQMARCKCVLIQENDWKRLEQFLCSIKEKGWES